MPFTITTADGSKNVTVNDSALTAIGGLLNLVGISYTGYPNVVAESFLRLLENFANATPPSTNSADLFKGQLWFDTTNNEIKVWSGTAWEPVTASGKMPTSAPSNPADGELYWNSTSNALFAYDGGNSQFIKVGPDVLLDTTTNTQVSIDSSISSTNSIPAVIFKVNNQVIAAITQATETVGNLKTSPTDYTQLFPNGVVAGLNLSNNFLISNIDAARLNNQAASFYLDLSNATGTISASTHGSISNGNSHSTATPTVNGFMSAPDKQKLDTVQANAEPNQNSYATINLTGNQNGDSSVIPGTASETMTLEAASPISITGDQPNDTITIGIDLYKTATITDNSAFSFAPNIPGGLILVSGESLNATGAFHFDNAGNINIFYGSAQFVGSPNSVLSGTTGSVGNFTVSYSVGDGNLYFENRLGNDVVVRIQTVGN